MLLLKKKTRNAKSRLTCLSLFQLKHGVMSYELQVIIVDDEESARNVLNELLARFCPEVNVLAMFEDIPGAVAFLQNHVVDIVFLDIEMPNYLGFEIVDFFDPPAFEIIFVTAYDAYAVKAFEILALDYLLKPVEVERLKQAVGRALNQKYHIDRNVRLKLLSETIKKQRIDHIVVTHKGYQYVLALDEVVAIEALESYCCVHTPDKQYVVSKNLKSFEQALEEDVRFFRVHKSWMVNVNHILSYSRSEGSIAMTNGVVAKLSRYKKADFERIFL
jgi:two-component system LytT family response regulator